MNNNYDFEDIKNKLRNKGAENGSLSDSDIELLLPIDISVQEIDDLLFFLEESGIDIINKENTLNIFDRINNKKPIDNVEECLLDDEVKQIIVDIKKIENNINDYRQQLKDIQFRSPIPLNRLKDISLLIFLEEEKMRGLQEQIIKAHVPLLRTIVDQYSNKYSTSLNNRDLLQESYLRLMVAAREFKYNSGESFSVFVSNSIRNCISEAIEHDKANDLINDYIKSNIDIYTDPHIRYEGIEFDNKVDSQSNKKSRHSKILITRNQDSTNKEVKLTLNESTTSCAIPSETTTESINNKIIPQLNIPVLGEVTPTIIKDESLLSIRLKTPVPKYRISSESKYSEQSFIDKLNATPEDNQSPSNNRIQKIYSKSRFDNDRRLSIYAKQVGERGEEIVIKHLYETLPENEKSTIKWTSKRGETPGWDIEYLNSTNNLVAIEVKGTTGNSFPNVEITANEWNAANELQERYWIYLVTGTFGINPKIQCLQNPVSLKESGTLRVTPILWKIEMISQ